MKRQAFSRTSLAQQLRPQDFLKGSGVLLDEEYKQGILSEAVRISEEGFTSLEVIRTRKAGKVCYSLNTLSEKLLMRLTATHLKKSFRVYQRSRSQIIDQLLPFLKDSSEYRIYKLDVMSFFESVDVDAIIAVIDERSDISPQTKLVVRSFLACCRAQGVTGLPRGMEVSPVLSEIALMRLDSWIERQDCLIYYARFVDDLIIITSAQESEAAFLQGIKQQLAEFACTLNARPEKRMVKTMRAVKQKQPPPDPVGISFLGYLITISTNCKETDVSNNEKKAPRQLTVDIAHSKIGKIKTKICKAFYSHKKSPDFQLLLDRLLFLSTNRKLYKNSQVLSGVYYNYSRTGLDSASLRQLDDFLDGVITAGTKRINIDDLGLSNEQIRKLRSVSFVRGHYARVFREFWPNRLREIGAIW